MSVWPARTNKTLLVQWLGEGKNWVDIIACWSLEKLNWRICSHQYIVLLHPPPCWSEVLSFIAEIALMLGDCTEFIETSGKHGGWNEFWWAEMTVEEKKHSFVIAGILINKVKFTTGYFTGQPVVKLMSKSDVIRTIKGTCFASRSSQISV